MNNYIRLTPSERDKLAIWKAEEVFNKECARRLKRSVSIIGREIKRNSFKGKYYVSIHAQGIADKKESVKAHLKQPLKNPNVYAYVTEKLRDGWSPDEIAGRLKLEHPDDRYWHICHETIYRWIYQPEQLIEDQPWYEYLRRKQKKRKKYQGRKVHRANIPDRISIQVRDEAINKREVFGHWEGDTVESRGHQDGIHTEVERLTRKIIAVKLKTITSEETLNCQKEIFGSLPKRARQSTTLDNGRETHLHFKLRVKLGMMTYHADPYSSWQRGTNEHGNWLLRYYFPKGTDFKTVPEEELQDVVEEINNRPRKILGYLTANELFEQKLQERGLGVALAT